MGSGESENFLALKHEVAARLEHEVWPTEDGFRTAKRWHLYEMSCSGIRALKIGDATCAW